jgi:hypothetical protein
MLAVLGTPWLGTALVADDPMARSDVALVLEGTGKDALEVAEAWRQAGLVQDVVIVEAPVKTHDLVAFWSDFVRWGMAPPAPTPAEHVRIVRAPSTQASEQARAAAPALQALHTSSVLAPGGGGIGTRVAERGLASVLEPLGISVHMPSSGAPSREPSRWYTNAEDRRAVLDSWLQYLVPYLSGYEPEAGS